MSSNLRKTIGEGEVLLAACSYRLTVPAGRSVETVVMAVVVGVVVVRSGTKSRGKDAFFGGARRASLAACEGWY